MIFPSGVGPITSHFSFPSGFGYGRRALFATYSTSSGVSPWPSTLLTFHAIQRKSWDIDYSIYRKMWRSQQELVHHSPSFVFCRNVKKHIRSTPVLMPRSENSLKNHARS